MGCNRMIIPVWKIYSNREWWFLSQQKPIMKGELENDQSFTMAHTWCECSLLSHITWSLFIWNVSGWCGHSNPRKNLQRWSRSKVLVSYPNQHRIFFNWNSQYAMPWPHWYHVWITTIFVSLFFSLLYVETADRPGLLVDLVKIITDINITVESGEFDTEVNLPHQYVLILSLSFVKISITFICWN